MKYRPKTVKYCRNLKDSNIHANFAKKFILYCIPMICIVCLVVGSTFSAYTNNQISNLSANTASFTVDACMKQGGVVISDIDVDQIYYITVENTSDISAKYYIDYSMPNYIKNTDYSRMSPWVEYVSIVVDDLLQYNLATSNSRIISSEIGPGQTITHKISFDLSTLDYYISFIESGMNNAILYDDIDTYNLYLSYLNQFEATNSYDCMFTIIATTSDEYIAPISTFSMFNTYSYSSYSDYYYTDEDVNDEESEDVNEDNNENEDESSEDVNNEDESADIGDENTDSTDDTEQNQTEESQTDENTSNEDESTNPNEDNDSSSDTADGEENTTDDEQSSENNTDEGQTDDTSTPQDPLPDNSLAESSSDNTSNENATSEDNTQE